MIQLNNLTAGYVGDPIVKGVTLDFRPGEVLALVGPNGSGKSTLLKAALGLLSAQGGQVLYDGRDLRELGRKEAARRAAYLTQSRNTPSITALRMVLHGRFPYLSYPRRYGREDYAMARRAMDRTGRRPHEDVHVQALSGGHRHGVYLAMTLAQATETVFLDEPTYLDVNRQLQTMETARELAQSGKAVALVLHDLPMALRGADRMAVLEEGKLLCWDRPEVVYASGVLDRVFGVALHRVETPYGPQYYATLKKEGL